MSDLQEYRRVINSARKLSGVDDPVAAGSAIDAVRQSLRGRSAQSGKRRKLIFLSSGIAAAAAVVIAVIVLIVNSPAHVSAAEALDQSAQATRDYKGWVHITPVTPKAPKSTTQPVLKALHINTSNGAIAIAFEIMGKLCIQMRDPEKNQEQMYSQANNLLVVSSVRPSDGAASMRRTAETPLKLAELLAQLKSQGQGEASVSQSSDGELEKFDVKVNADPAKVPQPFREFAHEQMVIWADPQTKLIRRMQTKIDGEVGLLEYTYGDPEIRDIHDLGVPRTVITFRQDAPTTPTTRPAVLDMPDVARLVKDDKTDLDALQARIGARITREFDDFVMIECEETVSMPRLDGRRHPREGRLVVQARQGEKQLYGLYLVAPAMIFFGGPGFPEGWPMPSLDSTLKVARRAGAVQIHVENGEQKWSFPAPKEYSVAGTTQPSKVVYMPPRLADQFWPSQLIAGGPGKRFTAEKVTVVMIGPKPELLHDPARPGLIVMHCEQSLPMFIKDGTTLPSDNSYHNEAYYWLDPAKDDLPVEVLMKLRSPGSPLSLHHELNLEFAQLNDGRWYPTRHQEHMTRPGEPAEMYDSYRDARRQILEGAHLPEEWYTDPTPRMTGFQFAPATTEATTQPAAP